MTAEHSTIVPGPGEGKVISQIGAELTCSPKKAFIVVSR